MSQLDLVREAYEKSVQLASAVQLLSDASDTLVQRAERPGYSTEDMQVDTLVISKLTLVVKTLEPLCKEFVVQSQTV